MVELYVLLDSGKESRRDHVLVEQLVQNAHLFLISSILLVDLINIVCDSATGHGESDDASKHDEDADDTLSECSGGEIAVAHRCDRRDSEVDARHVQI